MCAAARSDVARQRRVSHGDTLAIRYVKREPGEIVLDFEVR